MGLPNQGNITRGNWGQDLVVRGGILVTPSTAQVFYVGPQQTNDKGDLRSRSFATVDQALNACIDDRGDVIRLRPGYTENIAAAGWVNGKRGVRIEGMGTGTLRPTLTWNAAGSSLTGLKANMQLDNLNLFLSPGAGSVSVATAIVINAAGVIISNCFIRCSFSATSLATTCITVGAGADDCKLIGNEIWGIIAGTPTNCIIVTAAVNRLVISNCKIDVATSAVAVGPIAFTAAALAVLISYCTIEHLLASSTAAITGFAGVGGVVELCGLGIQAASGANAAIVTPGNLKLVETYAATPGKQAIVVGTPST
jgi:hypothetical protein